jgi:hypothetical protein
MAALLTREVAAHKMGPRAGLSHRALSRPDLISINPHRPVVRIVDGSPSCGRFGVAGFAHFEDN